MFKKYNKQFKVEGMKCDNCTKRVTNALKEIKGIKKVEVSLEEKTVKITSNKPIEDKEIENKINNLGYKYIK